MQDFPQMQLELHHISKTFGQLKANNDINFTFEEGKIYAILGENGAGKSTLMKIISGYQPPDPGGQLVINGKPVEIQSPSNAIQHGIGMLYQDPLDFPPMTVLENYLTVRPDTSFLPDWKGRRQELQTISQRFGFDLDPDALIESLTIGARQQLEIVRLLSLNVKFLILDEPTTGISEEQRRQLFATLKQLAREDHMTIVLVTHKLPDVEELCDEVLVLRYGRVTGTGQMPIPVPKLVEMMFGHPQNVQPVPPAPIREPVLEVKDLAVRTRRMELDDISLQVRGGEVIGLAGLDGSGQVEFMRACAGLDRASWRDHALSIVVLVLLLALYDYLLGYSQTVFFIASLITAALLLSPLALALLRYLVEQTIPIEFNGKSTHWLNYRDLRAQGMSYLSAGRLEEGLVAGMKLTHHFAVAKMGANPLVNWQDAKRTTQTAIQVFDIRGQVTSPIQTLSGGNQQRVALALLPENLKLAFLDNPTRGLDVNSAQNIWRLLLDRREDGTAIVFSSPDLDEIVQYSDRVIVFASGRCTIVEQKSDINTTTLGLLIGGKDAES
jgi:general nucleoside transport system ATP-binding protein